MDFCHQSPRLPQATANFDYAGLLAETILLGDIAIKAARKLEWDGPAMRITNNPQANKLLTREYCAGWTL